MIAEGSGRYRVAERNAAALARQRWQRLADQCRDAAVTAERAATALADIHRVDALRDAAYTLRDVADLAEELARP